MQSRIWGCTTKDTPYVCLCSVTFIHFVPHAYVAHDRRVVASRSVRCVSRTRQCLPVPWDYLDWATLCCCTRTCLQFRVWYSFMKFVRIAASDFGILWDVCTTPSVGSSMTVLGCLISCWAVNCLCCGTEVFVTSLGAMGYLQYIFVMSSCAMRCLWNVPCYMCCVLYDSTENFFCQNCLQWTGNFDLRWIKKTCQRSGTEGISQASGFLVTYIWLCSQLNSAVHRTWESDIKS
jgi:hypothetical protein